MRAFSRSVLPLLGLFMALGGGAVFLFSVGVWIKYGGLSTFGNSLLIGGGAATVAGIVLVRIGMREPGDPPAFDLVRDGDVYAMGGHSLLAMNLFAPVLALVGLVAGP